MADTMAWDDRRDATVGSPADYPSDHYPVVW
jgi:hypothetical protein